MSETKYEPGTVAMVRQFNAETERRAVRVGNVGWHLRPCSDAEDQAGLDFVSDALIAEVRPLVVLDLDEVVESAGVTDILPRLRRLAETGTTQNWACTNYIVGAIADQIEAQTKPARIPEPGSTGSIVKDSDRLWVKAGDGLWICLSDGQSGSRTSWPFLENPTLIREGVSE